MVQESSQAILKRISIDGQTVVLFSKDNGLTWFSNRREIELQAKQRAQRAAKIKKLGREFYVNKLD